MVARLHVVSSREILTFFRSDRRPRCRSFLHLWPCLYQQYRDTNGTHTMISGVPNLLPGFRIQCLEAWNGTIFAGGTFEHSVLGKKINGLFSFDLVQNNYSAIRPPALGVQTVSVQVIKQRPQSDQVYVGGTFDTADNKDCSTVCVYNALLGTWTRPGTDLVGSVTHMTWTSANTLIIAGNITLDGATTALAAYHVPVDQWTPFNSRAPLGGVVTAMTPASTHTYGSTWSSDRQEFWIAGRNADSSALLKKWNGTGWINFAEGYSADSVFHSVQLLSRSENGPKNDYINQDEYLLLLGDIGLPTGRASAALFNGTALQPWIFIRSSAGQPGKFFSMFMESSQTVLKGNAPVIDNTSC